MKYTVATATLFCLCTVVSKAQSPADNFVTKTFDLLPSQHEIVVDGIIDDGEWENCTYIHDFVMQAPLDQQPATRQTEVFITYTDRSLLILAICEDDEYVIPTLKRDQIDDSDAFAVVIDPVGQQTNGYAFGVNAYGAQFEALLAPNNVDESWDNRWNVKTQIRESDWIAEMEIPFKSMRYENLNSGWRINFIRVDPGNNETDVWSPVPRQFEPQDIGYFGIMNWRQAPEKTGGNVAAIPYIRSAHNNDLRDDTKGEQSVDFGGDAKIALSPTLNLDLTFNPDFSQVEVDRQVTNLTRFSIFFPERRQFFIENGDIFDSFGQFGNSPFYSRRIGLDAAGRTVPILYGIRLTGNVDSKLRIGAFNMHSKENETQLAQNFSSLVFERRIGQRSSIKGIFLNRQSFDGLESVSDDYGRNVGGEINLSTPDGKWQGEIGWINSNKPGFSDENHHQYGRIEYNGQRFRTFLNVQSVGTNYFADMGFNNRVNQFDPISGETTRRGYVQAFNMVNYYIYPENAPKINFHWSGIENIVYWYTNGQLNEWYTRFRHFIFFQNTSQLRIRVNHHFVDLLFPFAITPTPVPAGKYDMWEFNVQANSDVRRLLNAEIFSVYGDFYGGTKLTNRLELNYRTQPWLNLSIGVNRNDIWLPEPYGNTDLTLITGRFEINFSNSLFWTTFLQYNTQIDNFNINSRLQWRFAPMSDLFFVYTDNYAIDGIFGPKNRSIVLKCNYWITL